MTAADVTGLVRGIAPVVKNAIAAALEAFTRDLQILMTRVSTLEARALLPGPAGKDGLDGTDGTPGERGADGRDGRDGKDGADGVAGKDGTPGPRGDRGADGLDAFDLEVTYDGERTFSFVWTKLDPLEGNRTITRDFKVPVVLYRGVWVEGQPYETGDQVTWGGAQWIAKSATSARPGLAVPESRAWQLACKAGRDGKPGKDGRDGVNGKDGKDYGVWPRS